MAMYRVESLFEVNVKNDCFLIVTFYSFNKSSQCQNVGGCGSSWSKAVLIRAQMWVNHWLDSVQYHLVSELGSYSSKADTSVVSSVT